MLELFEDGIRAALLSTAERSDQLGNWTEILEVGWLGTPSPAAAATSEGVEAKSGLKGANLGFEIKSEVLRSLWWHCVYASPHVLLIMHDTHSLLISTVDGQPLSVSNCSCISAASVPVRIRLFGRDGEPTHPPDGDSAADSGCRAAAPPRCRAALRCRGRWREKGACTSRLRSRSAKRVG